MDLFTSPYPFACSAVGFAAKNGNVAKLKELLENGEDYTVKDNRGWYPLHEAANAGNLSCVEILLDAARKDCCTNKEIIDWVFPCAFDGETPLSLAAHAGNTEVVRVLAPLYVGCTCVSAGSPLHKACEVGSIECIESLLGNLQHLVNSRDQRSGMYPLHVSVEQQDINAVRLLLNNNADVDVQDLDDLKAPLHTAIINKNSEIVRLLMEFGCAVDITDSGGCTPLYLAAQCGCADVVQLLLEKKADPSIGMQLSDSVVSFSYPLSVAAEKGHLDIVKQLAEVTSTSLEGLSSAVILAALKMRTECLDFLLTAGFPTFKSTWEHTVDTPWDNLLSINNSSDFAQIVNILLQHNTTFHELVKPEEKISIKSSLLPMRLSNIQADILVAFLKAGLIELMCEWQTFPRIDRFILAYEEIKKRFLQVVEPGYSHRMSFFPNFVHCMSHFPFARFTNHAVGTLYHKLLYESILAHVPKLKQLCRWVIRCSVISHYGLINNKHLKDLDLPKVLKMYLIYE